MCDNILSCASDHLLPLARDHLLPILKEATDMIRGVSKEIAEMKDELESIEEFINNADRVADAEENNKSHGIRKKMKQLIEASFSIQDVIDEYIICEEQQFQGSGCVAGADLVKTMILRLKIAYKIQNIKSQINEIREKTDHGFQIRSEQGSSSFGDKQNEVLWQNLRKAPLYMDEADVVGFEEPKNILVGWLVEGIELTVVSVVAMGGQGKTTLAKIVFDNSKVIERFKYRVWIQVSQSYNVEGLLRDMLYKLYKLKGQDPPQRIDQMDRDTLIDEVRTMLWQARYVVVFDDVWNIHFWDEIKFAIVDNKNGSKILVTTRNMDVANACKKFCSVQVHELESLSEDQSLDLFYKKAFRDLNGYCPKNLIGTSKNIIEKCNGLPLAILITSGLLAVRKDKNAFQWSKFCENLNSELNKDSMINKILVLSYHDLPYNLKSCLLYFGIYPEGYVFKSMRLIRQWIAEGFVKEETDKNLEEVGEEYLTELINRNLVQVVSIKIDGRVKGCRVHDLVHAMILKKFDDLSFCKNISEDGQSTLTRTVRRLSIATNSDHLSKSIKSSQVRSLLILKPNTLRESFVTRIPTKYRLLKVLTFESVGIVIEVPKDLGSLIHLKYVSIVSLTRVGVVIPKSIGMLENLETLDLTGMLVFDFPKEICKLRKLRHFLGYSIDLAQLKDGIGNMTSLQTLHEAKLDGEFANGYEIVEVIQELGKLKQIKELGLEGVKRTFMSDLSSSINQMQQMEKLSIHFSNYFDSGDMDLHLNLPKLRYLVLNGWLDKLPEWIPKLQNLVKLKLEYSYVTDDMMELLKSMPNLLSISLIRNAYIGETLHFQSEWFMNLKELNLDGLEKLKYIHIDQGALPNLKRLLIFSSRKLKKLPIGIQHLKKLEYLTMAGMSKEFDLDGGKEHWIFKQVPFVKIYANDDKFIGGPMS